MKLWIMSDLHQEFDELRWHPTETPEHDVLILAGDIHWSIAKAIDYARPLTDKPILLLAGNHEFYGGSITEQLDSADLVAASPNVRFLENRSTVVGNVRFLGCTLWMDFNLYGADRKHVAIFQAKRYMNDFRMIRTGPTQRLFGPPDAIARFEESARFLKAELDRPWDGPTVVVTHHAPHPDSIPPEYQGDLLTPSFVNDLSELIERHRPDLWIHGHVHARFDYTVAGGTRIIANPRGYPQELRGFDPVRVVELETTRVQPAG